MIKLKNLKLIGLLSLLANLNSYTLSPDKQTQITQMFDQIFNSAYESTKGIETWIDELRTLIIPEPEFTGFITMLDNIKDKRSTNLVKLELLKHRKQAPAFLQNMLSTKYQTQIVQMLNQFLNPSCEPNKCFEAWIDELNTLISGEPEFQRFLPVLAKIRNEKNLTKVKLEIARNRTNAPKYVQDVLGTDLAKLSAILAARLRVRRG